MLFMNVNQSSTYSNSSALPTLRNVEKKILIIEEADGGVKVGQAEVNFTVFFMVGKATWNIDVGIWKTFI